jgi:hypothetical protein
MNTPKAAALAAVVCHAGCAAQIEKGTPRWPVTLMKVDSQTLATG